MIRAVLFAGTVLSSGRRPGGMDSACFFERKGLCHGKLFRIDKVATSPTPAQRHPLDANVLRLAADLVAWPTLSKAYHRS
jgi:hypothetical protein